MFCSSSFSVPGLQRKIHNKLCALMQHACYLNPAAHKIYNLFDNGKSQSRAGNVRQFGTMFLGKWFEHALHKFPAHANTRIFYCNPAGTTMHRRFQRFHINIDPAAGRRIFNSIRYNVQQYFLNLDIVYHQQLLRPVRRVFNQHNILYRSGRFHGCDYSFPILPAIHCFRFQY